MSEGERVVYIDSQLPTRPRWDNGDYRDFYDRDVPFLLSVAKKVPALQARIAELEGIIRNAHSRLDDICRDLSPQEDIQPVCVMSLIDDLEEAIAKMGGANVPGSV